jgi:hypothetical protein
MENASPPSISTPQDLSNNIKESPIQTIFVPKIQKFLRLQPSK